MRLLVTGATGFIGRHLVPYLVEKGYDVAILLREAYGMGTPLPAALITVRAQVSAVYADLRNLKLTRRAVAEAAPACIFHLAAAGVTDPFLPVNTALRHNLQGTLNLLQAAFATDISARQLVVARTPGELSAMNVYAASKAAAWSFCQMYARTHSWPIYGAMIFQAYGPGQPDNALIPSALRAARAGADFPMTSGHQERDWIYVEDVVRGLAATQGVALPPGTTVDLGTGQTTSVATIVRTIYDLVGRGGEPRPGVLPNRPGERPKQAADAARTATLLGWQAALTPQQGLDKLCRCWEEKEG